MTPTASPKSISSWPSSCRSGISYRTHTGRDEHRLHTDLRTFPVVARRRNAGCASAPVAWVRPGVGSAPVRGRFAGETADHEVDHREVDRGLRTTGRARRPPEHRRLAHRRRSRRRSAAVARSTPRARPAADRTACHATPPQALAMGALRRGLPEPHTRRWLGTASGTGRSRHIPSTAARGFPSSGPATASKSKAVSTCLPEARLSATRTPQAKYSSPRPAATSAPAGRRHDAGAPGTSSARWCTAHRRCGAPRADAAVTAPWFSPIRGSGERRGGVRCRCGRRGCRCRGWFRHRPSGR